MVRRFSAILDPVSDLRVVALALEGVVSFDIGCIVQTLGRGPGRTGASAGFTLQTCAVRPGRVATPDGFDLVVEHGLEALDTADLVVVPGRIPHDAPAPPEALAALTAAHDRGATVMSICIGAFVLAQAGLLDDRPATTHWEYAADLARWFPRVDLQPDRLYVDDGDVLTSAGLAAGLDLCLHVVRHHAGAAMARDLARWNVVAPQRSGGQAQFIPPPARAAVADPGLAPTLDFALERLHETLTVERLAEHAHLSPRTLRRRFERELGTTPKRWLLDQRVGRARALLETTEAPIEQVAAESGFASAAALRVHLRRHVASTPTAYRKRFA